MNEFLANVLATGTVILIVLGLVFLVPYLLRKVRERKMMLPKQLEHRKKEEAMLKNLLEDIAENTDKWFVMHEQEFVKNVLVNDYKNVGIMYGNNLQNISIFLNLKTLTEFNAQERDTAMINMSGPHVELFLKKAEAVIDKRGNELEFFKDKLYKQL